MADKTTETTETTDSGTTTKRRPWRRGSTSTATSTTAASSGGPGGSSLSADKLRVLLARLLWAVSAVFAVILALAVLLIAVEANADNELVRWIIARADNVDLGFFDLGNPIKDFDEKKGEIDDVKTALFNYGIAAIVWLAIGKFLDKVVRP
ncbi:hypothetical protein [Nocardioides sp.]|uniref:hypothetical protein n=1 Tax=Nocardioides sp. TaxID=35761 RepID=UPI0027223C26|nr:hypothetical protein [Nocardioides sp.]MDO9455760.1 hypothetical protein [Nocardioides sp.]